MSEIKKQILTLLKQRHHSHKVALEQEKDPRSKHAIDLIARIREDSRLMELIDSLPEDNPLDDPRFGDGFEAGRAVQRIFDGTDEDSMSEETCKDSLQVQETCKENQDSFTSLEEAAEDSWVLYEYRETPQGLYSSCYRDGFIAGAKWMESQMPMPEDTVIFMKGVEEGRRLEREDRNDDNLPRFYGD